MYSFGRRGKREDKGMDIRNIDKGHLTSLKGFENFFKENFLNYNGSNVK